MEIKHLEPHHREMLVRICEVTGVNLDDLRALYWEVLNRDVCSFNNIGQLLAFGIPIIDQLAEIYGITDDKVMRLAVSKEIKYENFERVFIHMTSPGGMYFNHKLC